MAVKYGLFSCLGAFACSILFSSKALQISNSYGVSGYSRPECTTCIRYDYRLQNYSERLNDPMADNCNLLDMWYFEGQKTKQLPSPVEIDETQINSQIPIIAYIAKYISDDLEKYFAENLRPKRSRTTIN